MTYSLKNLANLSAEGATFMRILWGGSRNGSLKRLNNSKLDDNGVL